MNPERMRRTEFEGLSVVSDRFEIIHGHALILLPAGDDDVLHESGYRWTDVVVERFDAIGVAALVRLGTKSDVIHIEGISGLGLEWHNGDLAMNPPVRRPDWRIDFLPISGLVRLAVGHGRRLIVGPRISSLEIFSEVVK